MNRAPRFYANGMISAELQVNNWIRKTSGLYGSFHGPNPGSMAYTSHFNSSVTGDMYLVCEVRHADGWILIIPASVNTNLSVTHGSEILTKASGNTHFENGIYYNRYNPPTTIAGGERYKVTVSYPDNTAEIFTPFETTAVQPVTLNPFLAASIPKDFGEWNKISEAIDQVSDTVNLNTHGFISVKDNNVSHTSAYTEWEGIFTHTESNLLFKVEWNKPYHDAHHTSGTFGWRVQIQVPGSADWTDIGAYNYLVLKNQSNGSDPLITVWDVGMTTIGDYIEGAKVLSVDAPNDQITFESNFPIRQLDDAIDGKIPTFSTLEEISETRYTNRAQHSVLLPAIPEGAVYKYRLLTYGAQNQGNARADILFTYLGEVTGSTSVSSHWRGMKRWGCGDTIGGEPGRKLEDIITNIEYLRSFPVMNFSAPKLRDSSTSAHVGLIFHHEKRFLSYYLESTAGHTEFQPKISYYNFETGKWVMDSLETTIDTWHLLDLNTVDGLHSGEFYTLTDLSYAMEADDGS